MSNHENLESAIEEVREHLQANPLPARRGPAGGPRLTPDQLEWAGELLFGRNWKTELAEVMGWSDARRVRAMVRGDRAIPAGVTTELEGYLRQRAVDCIELADEFADLLAAHVQDKAAAE